MFSDCKTLEELKKAYHALAIKHHPDKGGDLEMMKAVNNAYDKFFAKLKNCHVNAKGEIYEKENAETPDQFKDIISELLKKEGLVIEIIGCFIWVTGDTKTHKDVLKEMGFKWHSKKICWYLAPEGYRRFSKKQFSLEDIRMMYGSQEYRAANITKLQAAI